MWLNLAALTFKYSNEIWFCSEWAALLTHLIGCCSNYVGAALWVVCDIIRFRQRIVLRCMPLTSAWTELQYLPTLMSQWASSSVQALLVSTAPVCSIVFLLSTSDSSLLWHHRGVCHIEWSQDSQNCSVCSELFTLRVSKRHWKPPKDGFKLFFLQKPS